MSGQLFLGMLEDASDASETVFVASADAAAAMNFDENGFNDGTAEVLVRVRSLGLKPAQHADLEAVCRELGIPLEEDNGRGVMVSTEDSLSNELIGRAEVREALEAKGFDHYVGFTTIYNECPDVTIFWKRETFAVLPEHDAGADFAIEETAGGSLDIVALTAAARRKAYLIHTSDTSAEAIQAFRGLIDEIGGYECPDSTELGLEASMIVIRQDDRFWSRYASVFSLTDLVCDGRIVCTSFEPSPSATIRR